MTRNDLINAFISNPRGGIVVVRGYNSAQSGHNEDIWLNVGINWLRANERSAAKLKSVSALSVALGCPTTTRLEDPREAQRIAELALAKVNKSVDNVLAGVSTRPSPFRELAPGLYIKRDDDVVDLTAPVYIRGLFNNVFVNEHSTADKKIRRSKDVTLVRRWIEKDLPTSRFQTVKLDWRSFDTVSVNGQRFTPSDLFINSNLRSQA
tara:strand:+ start:876 stop:1499 length:624 start_codon:yes stop_codon:yes gene_type:complete